MSLTGNLILQSGADFSIQADTGQGSDMVDVTGSVNVTGADLLTDFGSLSSVTEEGDLVLIQNDGTDAVVGTFNGLAEGALVQAFGAGGGEYRITYVYDSVTGATTGGNDVALVAMAESTATIVGNDLVIGDSLGSSATADGLTVSMSGSNVRIVSTNSINARDITGAVQIDPNTIEIPASAFAGSIIFNGGGGNDTLTIDVGDTGGLFAKQITFNGDGQTGSPGDTLVINDSNGGLQLHQ